MEGRKKLEDDKEKLDEDEVGGPEMPRGVVGRHRGWQGEQLEMDHQLEVVRSGKQSAAAAVDIRQFQNTVVGEGYQAKHVVRQRSAQPTSDLKIQDMTGGTSFRNDKEQNLLKSDTGARNYIENEGLREFRKEIESILSSS